MNPIDIVLATYNGESFIEEQIHSIQNNIDYQDLINQIIVVDDGSTDQTFSIIERLSSSDPKIVWVPSLGEPLGASQNFSRGIGLSRADYVMLCDQDDVWLEYKISRSFQKIQIYSENSPALIFSDLLIVDQKLNVISRSYYEIKKINKNWHQCFSRLLLQNVASGCTMLFNRSLINMACPIDPDAYMHDWWLILIASHYGQVAFIDEPLVMYRQHGGNTIGVSEMKRVSYITKLNNFVKSFDAIVLQARKIHELTMIENLRNDTLQALVRINHRSRLMNFACLLKGDLARNTWLGNVAVFVYIFFFAKTINSRVFGRPHSIFLSC